jgi:ribonucleoside-diphosphate reductase alpha chain
MIKHKFNFKKENIEILKKINIKPLTLLGNIIFEYKYAKNKENFKDCIIRVVEGNFSIRKNHYINNHLKWDEDYWEGIAFKSAISAFKREWLPAGRHLKMCGTNYINKHGSLALNNCAAITTENLYESAKRMTIFLQNGCGVGFDIKWLGNLKKPQKIINIDKKKFTNDQHILNTIKAWTTGKTLFLSDSPEQILINENCKKFYQKKISRTEFILNIFNIIGTNIDKTNNRSAQIAIGIPEDKIFLELKNYKKYPHRFKYGWISNNSVIFSNKKQFSKHLYKISEQIKEYAEPGIINLLNIQKYGRLGHIKKDPATLVNPCSEIALEPNELCNLSSTFPQNCNSIKQWFTSLKYATINASNATLLPTQFFETNEIIAKNRRIGISISGLPYLFDNIPMSKLIKYFRKGYKIVEKTNKELAKHAGIPKSIKLTCIKPEGSISFIADTCPGIHYPISNYIIRRIRFNKKSKIVEKLIQLNIPNEIDLNNKNQIIFSFPLKYENVRSIKHVNLATQLSYISLLQREFCDNLVSATCFYNEQEEEDIEKLIALFIPILKSLSMMKINNTNYKQAPIEIVDKNKIKNLEKHIKSYLYKIT